MQKHIQKEHTTTGGNAAATGKKGAALAPPAYDANANGKLPIQRKKKDEDDLKKKKPIQRKKKEEDDLKKKKPIQRKAKLGDSSLQIDAPNSPLEKEADMIAEQIVRRMSAPTDEKPAPLTVGGISRSVAGSTEGSMYAPAHVASELETSKGHGQPLPSSLRTEMEGVIGSDLSGVRIHTDSKAAELSEAVNAQAFTYGQDVYFNQGKYQPGSLEGVRLLGHEVGHVGQENNSGHEPYGPNRIQKWSDSDHESLTREGIEILMSSVLKDVELDKNAEELIVEKSTNMDYKLKELYFNILGFFKGKTGEEYEGYLGSIPPSAANQSKLKPLRQRTALSNLIEHYSNNISSALNHGEGGEYRYPRGFATNRNEIHQQSYISKAKDLFSKMPDEFKSVAECKIIKENFTKEIFAFLGDALHVAQDRGAHGEGAVYEGHSRQIWEPQYDPDDPGINSKGYREAQHNTDEVLWQVKEILKLMLDKSFHNTCTKTVNADVNIISRKEKGKQLNLPQSNSLKRVHRIEAKQSVPKEKDTQEATPKEQIPELSLKKIAAVALAESEPTHEWGHETEIAKVYYRKWLKSKRDNELNYSSTYKKKLNGVEYNKGWYRIYMVALGDKEYSGPYDQEKNPKPTAFNDIKEKTKIDSIDTFLSNTAIGKCHFRLAQNIYPKIIDSIKKIDPRNIKEEVPWTDQGFFGDMNLPKNNKLRRYWRIQNDPAEEVPEYIRVLPADIGKQYTFLINTPAIEAFFRKNPEYLKKAEDDLFSPKEVEKNTPKRKIDFPEAIMEINGHIRRQAKKNSTKKEEFETESVMLAGNKRHLDKGQIDPSYGIKMTNQPIIQRKQADKSLTKGKDLTSITDESVKSLTYDQITDEINKKAIQLQCHTENYKSVDSSIEESYGQQSKPNYEEECEKLLNDISVLKEAKPKAFNAQDLKTNQDYANWILEAENLGFAEFTGGGYSPKNQIIEIKEGKDVKGKVTKDVKVMPALITMHAIVKGHIERWIQVANDNKPRIPFTLGSFIRSQSGSHSGESIDINAYIDSLEIEHFLNLLNDLPEGEYTFGFPFQGQFFDKEKLLERPTCAGCKVPPDVTSMKEKAEKEGTDAKQVPSDMKGGKAITTSEENEQKKLIPIPEALKGLKYFNSQVYQAKWNKEKEVWEDSPISDDIVNYIINEKLQDVLKNVMRNDPNHTSQPKIQVKYILPDNPGHIHIQKNK